MSLNFQRQCSTQRHCPSQGKGAQTLLFVLDTFANVSLVSCGLYKARLRKADPLLILSTRTSFRRTLDFGTPASSDTQHFDMEHPVATSSDMEHSDMEYSAATSSDTEHSDDEHPVATRFDMNAFFDGCKTIPQMSDRIHDFQHSDRAPHIITFFKGCTSYQQNFILHKDGLWPVQSATELTRTLFGESRTPEDFLRQVKTAVGWGPRDGEGISTAQVKHTVGKSKLQSTLFKRDNIVFKVETRLLTPPTHSQMSSAEGVQDASELAAEALTVGSNGQGKESSGNQAESKGPRWVYEVYEGEEGGCTLQCKVDGFNFVEAYPESGESRAFLLNEMLGIEMELDRYIFTGPPATEGSELSELSETEGAELSEDPDWVTLDL